MLLSCTLLLLLLLLLFNFQLYFQFFYNPSSGVYTRPSMKEVSDYMYSMYLCLFYLFWVIIFSHTGSTLLRRWQFCNVQFFSVSYRLGLPGILLMCFSVHFLIILSAPTITGMVVVLKCHVSSISISLFLYWVVNILWLLCHYLFVLIRRHVFFL